MIVSDSAVEFTPDLQLRARHGRAVTGPEVATSASAMRENAVFLRLVYATLGPAP